MLFVVHKQLKQANEKSLLHEYAHWLTSWYALAIYSQVFTNNVFPLIELVSSIAGLGFSRKSNILASPI